MRTMLLDLAPGQDYAIKFRSIGETASSEWSKVYKLRTAGDTIAPAAPTGLVWRATGSSFQATWNKVTLDGDGGSLKDFRDYEVTVTANSVSKTFYVIQPSFELTLAGNAEAFGIIAYTVQISVKSRDLSDNKSAAATATATEDTPPKPSTPVVTTTSLGQLKVVWDGNPATGIRNDLNLNHVEIHASTANNFTPTTGTLVDRFEGLFPGTQSQILGGLTYGTLYYIKLVAVNRFNRSGTPSDQATGTPARLTGLDVADGQIGTAQINFTARDIGGANVYFPATTTARDALTGVKNGDIAYVTGSGYATYRYNGTTWVAAPEVGVIAGTKILAGTLTSDAVGTNLLITATANIANGIIDNAKISQLDAGKITTGTLQSSATVTYGSSAPRPTWQLLLNGDAFLNNVNVRGQIVIGNSGDTGAMNTAATVRSFDYLINTAGWAIKGDGTVEFNNGTFRGNIIGATITSGSIVGAIYKTSATGRRIEINTSGSQGEINFYAPDNTRTYIRSLTSPSAPGLECIQVLAPITGADPSWNGFTAQTNESVFAVGRNVLAIVGGTTSAVQRGFNVSFAPDKTNFLAPGFRSLLDIQIDDTQAFFTTAGSFRVNEHPTSGADLVRLYIVGTGSNFIYHAQGQATSIVQRNPDGSLYNRFFVDDNDCTFLWPGSISKVTVNPPDFAPYNSARIQFVNGNSYGGYLKLFYDGSGVIGIHSRNAFDTGWQALFASAFTVASDGRMKTEMTTAKGTFLKDMMDTPIRSYRRKHDDPDIVMPIEIGLDASEAPPQITTTSIDGMGMVDLYQYQAFQHAAFQQFVVEMREEITKIKATLNKKKEG